MTSSYLIFATFAMAAETFITRALPALIPRKLLDTPWLHRLNESLPLSVMVLLILTSLSYQDVSTTVTLSDTELHLLMAHLSYQPSAFGQYGCRYRSNQWSVLVI